MALTFPRLLPSPHRISTFAFDLLRFDVTDVGRDGHMTAAQVAPARWQFHAETVSLFNLGVADNDWRYVAGAYAAWLDSLRGSQRTFLAHPPNRPYPQAYLETGFTGLTRAVGGTSFADGLCTYATILAGRDGFTISALPASFVFKAGDFVSLQWDIDGAARRSLHRIMEDVTATGSGVAPVLVEPTVYGLAPSSGTACVLKPDTIFRLDPEKRPTMPNLKDFTSVITFDAIEALSRT